MILQTKNKEDVSFNESPEDVNADVVLKRKELKYENHSGKFVCSKINFKRQFSHIYDARLNALKPRIILASSNKWGSHIPLRKLSELSDENCEKCIVIGTLFKHQELKPSILKEISEENKLIPQPVLTNFVSENDQLILEDEVQRIRLKGNFDIKKLITGVVAGLLGFENEEGKFEVEEMCFGGVNCCPQKPLPSVEDSYLLIVSGLNLKNSSNILTLELLTDWIEGECGSILDQCNSAKICRVLIVGNSISCSQSLSKTSIINTDIEEELDTLTAVKQLDETLVKLASTIEVDIMPGEFDPSNHLIPQQAFYDCLFPNASKYATFHSVTNPYECILGGVRFLGTSGQTVEDIKSISDFSDSLDILESTLNWGHMAPSAPDTLDCYPYYNEDPFVINHQPHVYFVGNQSEYKTKTIYMNGQVTRLISVPTFYNTQTCVLLNLKTLESTPLTFRV